MRLRDRHGRRAEVLIEEPAQVARTYAQRLGELVRPVVFQPPSAMRASARDTVFAEPRHPASPGATSGRQRRHGRKPRSWAAPALGRKMQLSIFGRARRADRTAIDARGEHGGVEASVETRVARAKRRGNRRRDRDRPSSVPRFEQGHVAAHETLRPRAASSHRLRSSPPP